MMEIIICDLLAQVFDCVKYFPVGQTHSPSLIVKMVSSVQVWQDDELVQVAQLSGQPIIVIICDHG